MNTSVPRLAVLIPAYDAENIIGRAIASLNANAEPHDIIVVDDGSRTPLRDVLPPQANLVILRQERNSGIVNSLNIGLSYILEKKYDYVARLDADDTSAPDRLALQRAFLDEHPDISLVGSWGRIVSEQGKVLWYLQLPTEHRDIAKALYYNNCMAHSTLMMRTSLFRKLGMYSDTSPHAEDYELMRKCIQSCKAANIPHYLIDYTMSPEGLIPTPTD